MDAWTTSLAALGGLLAARFSGLNLYLSGVEVRRDVEV